LNNNTRHVVHDDTILTVVSPSYNTYVPFLPCYELHTTKLIIEYFSPYARLIKRGWGYVRYRYDNEYAESVSSTMKQGIKNTLRVLIHKQKIKGGEGEGEVGGWEVGRSIIVYKEFLEVMLYAGS